MGKLDELMQKALAVYSDDAAPGGRWAQFEAEARAMMAAHYPELWQSLGVGEVAFFDHGQQTIFFQTNWPDLYALWDGRRLHLFDNRRWWRLSTVVWDASGVNGREDDDIGLFLLDAHWLRGGK